MGRRSDPGWRDGAAAGLLLRHIPPGDSQVRALLMDDPLPDTASSLAGMGYEVTRWNRRALQGLPASPWPPSGPFQLTALRLPRSREELVMDLHAAARAVEPGGSVLVYGAKDEGIRSVQGPMEELFTGVHTLGVGGRCRVLFGTRPSEISGEESSLASWRREVELDYPGLEEGWVSYPGVFAHGRLDEGTRLLLDALPVLPPGARTLDYGCGSGPVAAVARSRQKTLELELLDVDAVALEAARENLPGAVLRLREGLPEGDGSFDAIVSNPPFHRGKEEDPAMIRDFIWKGSRLLTPEGVLVFVAQRRLRLQSELGRCFREVAVLDEDATFEVLQGARRT